MKKAIVALGISGLPLMVNAQNVEPMNKEGLICEDEARINLNTTNPIYSNTGISEKQVTKKEDAGRNKKRLHKSLFADWEGIDLKNIWGVLNRN